MIGPISLITSSADAAPDYSSSALDLSVSPAPISNDPITAIRLLANLASGMRQAVDAQA